MDEFRIDRNHPGRNWLRAFVIGILAIYGTFFFLFLLRTGPADYDQFLVFHKLQYWNASLFGLAKQWSPVMCSGLSLAGEPQVPFMSLSMLLSYVIAPESGLRAATMLYFIVGWFGALLYAGLWFKVMAPRVLAAALFVGNGFFVCRMGYGHIDFIPFLVLPMVLWLLHRFVAWQREGWSIENLLRILFASCALGAAFALAIDGSPVAIIHLLFWIGLYAAVLAFCQRAILPAVAFGIAVAMAGMLDAGYLWPMLQAQTSFPRRTPDSFTSLLSFLWFAIVPMRGKVLPANGNGHELSVFIGPVLAWLLWRYRHWLSRELPQEMKRPLWVVTIASLVLGMGSLKGLHVPTWLSPFDLLRPLPGFRSIGVTGRYWGFLALPLSLLSAAALWRFVAENTDARRMRWWLAAAMSLQWGFQGATLMDHWVRSPVERGAAAAAAATWRGAESIQYVATRDSQFQGEFISPTRGVVNCYDMDDFIRAETEPGRNLIRRVVIPGHRASHGLQMHANFLTWSHIQLQLDPDRSTLAAAVEESPNSMVRIVLNQAFHPLWQVSGCQVQRNDRGNLVLSCPLTRLQSGPIDLTFDDHLSDLAARTSTRAWYGWTVLATLLGSALAALRVRRRLLRPAEA